MAEVYNIPLGTKLRAIAVRRDSEVASPELQREQAPYEIALHTEAGGKEETIYVTGSAESGPLVSLPPPTGDILVQKLLEARYLLDEAVRGPRLVALKLVQFIRTIQQTSTSFTPGGAERVQTKLVSFFEAVTMCEGLLDSAIHEFLGLEGVKPLVNLDSNQRTLSLVLPAWLTSQVFQAAQECGVPLQRVALATLLINFNNSGAGHDLGN